jgi:hypothetical protein
LVERLLVHRLGDLHKGAEAVAQQVVAVVYLRQVFGLQGVFGGRVHGIEQAGGRCLHQGIGVDFLKIELVDAQGGGPEDGSVLLLDGAVCAGVSRRQDQADQQKNSDEVQAGLLCQ